MVVSTEERSTYYVGDGVEDTFSFSFQCLEPSDMYGFVDGVEDANTLTVLNSDQKNNPGGELTFNSGAPAALTDIAIIRTVDGLQNTAYTDYGVFPARSHERNLDKLTMLYQQYADSLSRALSLGDTYPGDLPIVMEDPESGRYLAWNLTGTGLINADAPSVVIPQENEATVAAMVADADLVAGDTVFTQGYDAAGDGGHAQYLVKTVAQAATDGDVIDGYGNHAITGGLYVAILQHDTGVVNAAHYTSASGVVTNSIHAARDRARVLGTTLHIPAGTYIGNFEFAGTVANQWQNLKITGDGLNTILQRDSDLLPVLYIHGESASGDMLYPSVTGIKVDGNGASLIPAVELQYTQTPALNDIYVSNAVNSLSLHDKVYDGEINGFIARDPNRTVADGYGILLGDDCNYMTINEGRVIDDDSTSTKYKGIYITGSTVPGYHTINGGQIENCSHGVVLENCRGVTVDGCHIEGHGKLTTGTAEFRAISIVPATNGGTVPWGATTVLTNNKFFGKDVACAFDAFIEIDLDGAGQTETENLFGGWNIAGNHFATLAAQGGDAYGVKAAISLKAFSSKGQLLRLGSNNYHGNGASGGVLRDDVVTTPANAAGKRARYVLDGDQPLYDNWYYASREIATFTPTMSGSLMTTTNAVAAGSVSLPDAKVGMSFDFLVAESKWFQIDPASGEAFRAAAAADKYIRSAATPGEYLSIRCVDDGIWDVVNEVGTWTYEA